MLSKDYHFTREITFCRYGLAEAPAGTQIDSSDRSGFFHLLLFYDTTKFH